MLMNKWNPRLNKTPVYKFNPIPKSKSEKKPDDLNKFLSKTNEVENGLDWLVIISVLSMLLCLQAVLSAGSYSGQGAAPMFGDFEAQRHWMEITFHLPITEWYFNTSRNDLLYWGLDYPPLTAYHSYLMGFVADKIDPSWVALFSSRGIESPDHKLFMRITAILPYIAMYVTSVFLFSKLISKKFMSKNLFFALACLYPGLLAMDCAHFQYNSISLGLFLFAIVSFHRDRTLIGSVMFVLALNYKQMELYHSLPIFVFILARCLKRPLLSRVSESFVSITKVGIVVIATFAILWLPFLIHGADQVFQLLKRIFPFYRGLYEDKVASVWCSFSFILKLNNWLSQDEQIKLSTACVLLASSPGLIVLFFRSSLKNFRISLFTTSLCFFLFSFQVHEKSILLPAIAGLLLLPEYPLEILVFLQISCTSLFPLCVKDGNPFLLVLFASYSIFSIISVKQSYNTWNLLLSFLYIFLGYLVCIAEWVLVPPERYPHIFILMNALYSCISFLLCLGYFYYRLLAEEYIIHTRKQV